MTVCIFGVDFIKWVAGCLVLPDWKHCNRMHEWNNQKLAQAHERSNTEIGSTCWDYTSVLSLWCTAHNKFGISFTIYTVNRALTKADPKHRTPMCPMHSAHTSSVYLVDGNMDEENAHTPKRYVTLHTVGFPWLRSHEHTHIHMYSRNIHARSSAHILAPCCI